MSTILITKSDSKHETLLDNLAEIERDKENISARLRAYIFPFRLGFGLFFQLRFIEIHQFSLLPATSSKSNFKD